MWGGDSWYKFIWGGDSWYKFIWGGDSGYKGSMSGSGREYVKVWLWREHLRKQNNNYNEKSWILVYFVKISIKSVTIKVFSIKLEFFTWKLKVFVKIRTFSKMWNMGLPNIYVNQVGRKLILSSRRSTATRIRYFMISKPFGWIYQWWVLNRLNCDLFYNLSH